MFKILTGIKNVFVHVRSSLKLIFLIIIASTIIISIISFFYKPVYAVSLNGEIIGYVENKVKLQEEINNYIQAGEENNIAFIDLENLPKYSLCLRKRTSETNEKEIIEKIKTLGKTYYEYYAIVQEDEIKYYVASQEEAEGVISELKDKKSSNIDEISYTQIFDEELKEFTEKDTIVTALYKKKPVYYSGYSGTYTIAYEKINLGIDLTIPVKSGYTITSRFGPRWGTTHTGTDVAAPTGTPIVAAAAGTVTFSGNQGNGYGNYVVIDHGNGITTIYAHCNTLNTSTGEYVSQGQKIAEVGSTGNSSGPHLHFEVRVNGTITDPQNYIY